MRFAQLARVNSGFDMQLSSPPGRPLVCENSCSRVIARLAGSASGKYWPTVSVQRICPFSTSRARVSADSHLLAEAMRTRVPSVYWPKACR